MGTIAARTSGRKVIFWKAGLMWRLECQGWEDAGTSQVGPAGTE
jgi:hypothetical protein